MPWLYEFPMWVHAALFAAVLLVGLEGGYRVGLRTHRTGAPVDKQMRGDVTLGSMLALLGLILAFTYAFTLSRADMRKQARVDEANAISTAFLRADLAAEPGRSELRERLLVYARTRVFSSEKLINLDALQDALARSLEAQSHLWPAAKLALQGDVPVPLQASIVHAVNEVLNAHTRRLAAGFDRLPGVVFALLLLIAASALAIAGHNAGLKGRMNRGRMTAFAFILGALMLIILDFDRPLVGTIRLNNQSLLSVIAEMESALESEP
jgi:hypothetical protein